MAPSSKTVLRLADLPNRTETEFLIEPDAPARAELVESLGIRGLRKVRFAGKMSPEGKRDWILTATIGATVVQDCVITLEPVTTRIDEKIRRTYSAEIDEPKIGEVEMPEDDSIEPLPATIDLLEVMEEALSLALPPFPRAEGAELGSAVFTEPGVKPMTDEETRPFASLSSLKDRLEKKSESDD